MLNLASVDIKERERINATLTSFLSLPAWTPAMGALLVSGVMPIAETTLIAAEGYGSLRNPTVPASDREIQRARQVLETWIEWYLDKDDGAENTQALSASLAPLEFLRWCVEDYEDLAEWERPDWLSYWTSFCEWESRSGVPLPAPSRLVARAASLEHVFSFKSSERPDREPPALTLSADNVAYVDRVSASIISNPKSPIASQIVQALGSTEDPHNFSAVWVQLCKMAESKKHVVLRYVSDTALEIPAKKTGWKKYHKSALEQYLRRHNLKEPVADQLTPNV